MAAITPFLNEPDDEAVENVAVPLAGLAGLGDADDVAAEAEPVGADKDAQQRAFAYSHAELTRFVWNRSLLEKALAAKQFWVEVERRPKLENTGHLVFRLGSPVAKDTIPWSLAPGAVLDSFPFWGEAAKMDCPTWDLPAGSPLTGGTCIAATVGQSTIPAAQKRAAKMLRGVGGRLALAVLPPGASRPVRYREGLAICQFCYASGGNYAYANIQGGEIVRYWWSRWITRTAEGRAEFARLVMEGLKRRPFPKAALAKHGILPVRVHSSGDFFSRDYALAWMEVANLAHQFDPRIRFWCPTRTWAAPGWAKAWPDILAHLRQPNLIIRPSAYHTNDPAPGPLVPPGTNGYATGTAAIFKGSPRNADDRADFDCPVYASEGKDAKNCDQGVVGGSAGCRTCWVRPDLRVNYTVH